MKNQSLNPCWIQGALTVWGRWLGGLVGAADAGRGGVPPAPERSCDSLPWTVEGRPCSANFTAGDFPSQPCHQRSGLGPHRACSLLWSTRVPWADIGQLLPLLCRLWGTHLDRSVKKWASRAEIGVCLQQADVTDTDGRVSVARCYLKHVLAVLKVVCCPPECEKYKD